MSIVLEPRALYKDQKNGQMRNKQNCEANETAKVNPVAEAMVSRIRDQISVFSLVMRQGIISAALRWVLNVIRDFEQQKAVSALSLE